MNHAAEGLLLAYLDGEATSAAAAEIEGHLAGCSECRSELPGPLFQVGVQVDGRGRHRGVTQVVTHGGRSTPRSDSLR